MPPRNCKNCHKIIQFVIAVCLLAFINTNTIWAQAASTEPTKANHVNTNLKKMFKFEGMSPGMQQKMSFLALTTSKIDREEKAAIRKQLQRTFQNPASN